MPPLLSWLYPYPFDQEGGAMLTLQENLAATRELELKLNALIRNEWRWPELQLAIVGRLGGVVTYAVEWRGSMVGRITIDIENTDRRAAS